MSMTSAGLNLTKPLAATAAVRTWPGVTRRALTREEREWLEAVPAVPLVDFRGVETVWVRKFFCGLVEHALRTGSGTVGTRDGVPVAALAGGEHKVLGSGHEDAGRTPAGKAAPAGQGRGRSFFSGGWKTWIEHSQPKEARA